jgi:hypothetical protein
MAILPPRNQEAKPEQSESEAPAAKPTIEIVR